jgi:hypothetical protein
MEKRRANHVAVRFSCDDFSESLVNEWRRGRTRVLRQNTIAVELAGRSATPPAWLLVTCYYAAFFAAYELVRSTGKLVLYLDPEEARTVADNSQGAFEIERGVYVGTPSPDAGSGYVEVNLHKSAAQPHAFVWATLRDVTGRMLRSSTRRPLLCSRFVDMLGTASWSPPNAVRNEWNYADPTLYGTKGENLRRTLFRIMQDPARGYEWAVQRSLQSTPENLAASIAFIRAVLAEACDVGSERLGGSR